MSKEIIISTKNASTTNNGIFQGWGTSLCWWANRVGYSPALTEKCADLFFSEKGLNLNIMRYNIGGGDDPAHKHIKRTDSMIPGWLYYDKESNSYYYNYEADKNQLNVMKKCLEASGSDAFVEVFSNSPPYFMTKSGCSSGGKNPNKNNLKDECYEEFAEYLANVTEYINNTLKIKVSSISPMNEPNTKYWHAFSEKQEGCHFDAGESQNKILLETYKAIKKRGLDHIELVGSDETSTEKQITAYNKYSDEVKTILDRISTHTYGTRKIKQLGALMKADKRNLWMSETDWSNEAGKNAGDMSGGLWLAKKIIEDINALSPSAWVLWQVIDYHISKDGYMGNKDFGMPNIKGGFWGLAVADHDKEEIILSNKYYAMGQFSKYIRPGDTIIHCDKNTLSAYKKDSGKIVIVAVNDTSKTKHITYSLECFESIGKTAKIIRTSGSLENGEKWALLGTVDVTDNKLKVDLKSNSITTFIIE
ncbi:MAG: hypothetical protein IJN94_04840 [Clostridia bacterium]|nr:hypothetical protein [Clostridia bacterium]